MNKAIRIVSVALILLLASAAGVVLSKNISSSAVEAIGSMVTDSGISACQEMADRAGKPKSTEEKAPMTEAEYHRVRQPFEQSVHVDLQVAGTNLVDTIYKADKMLNSEDDSVGGALGVLMVMQNQWNALQVACGKHGVILPNLAQ